MSRHPLWIRGVLFWLLPRTPRRQCTRYFPQGVPACPVVSTGGPPRPVAWYYCRDPPEGYPPPPSLLVARRNARQSFPDITILCNLQSKSPYASSSPPLEALPSLASPSPSTLPTRTAWRPLSWRFILLDILALIYMALCTPSMLIKIKW